MAEIRCIGREQHALLLVLEKYVFQFQRHVFPIEKDIALEVILKTSEIDVC